LLVEDNPGDVGLVREALKKRHRALQLHVVSTGEDALAFLRHQEPYADAPVPDLVLLDLNLPGKTGYDVLAEIKQDPGLRSIPVVVLTTTDKRRDIQRCYALGANAYIVKPMEVETFLHLVRASVEFLRACKGLVQSLQGSHAQHRR
jgi:CheY-like chemotaxis protein